MPLLFWIIPPFCAISPFLEIQDVPTLNWPIGKTKVLNVFFKISTLKVT